MEMLGKFFSYNISSMNLSRNNFDLFDFDVAEMINEKIKCLPLRREYIKLRLFSHHLIYIFFKSWIEGYRQTSLSAGLRLSIEIAFRGGYMPM